MKKQQKYLVTIRVEPDDPTPAGHKGEVIRKTIIAYSKEGAIKKGAKFGEVLEAWTK